MAHTCVLSVFFEGTANTLDPITTQIGVFAAATMALDVSERGGSPTQSPFKMAFDGCGVTNGLSGLLFASGLVKQCRAVVQRIDELLAAGAGRVRCNALGLSRGGLALFILAKQLSRHADVDLNLCLFDPVPGNMVSTGFPFTGRRQADLSDCMCLRRVLAIYPYEPLPDVALHAPMLGIYPQGCEVEEDVTLGCHQGALFRTRKRPQCREEAASNLSFHRISAFLASVGTDVDISGTYAGAYFEPSSQEVLEIYRETLQGHEHPSRRITHDRRGRLIVRRPSRSKPRFVNRHHETLEADANVAKRGSWALGSSAGGKDEPPIRYLLDFEYPSRHGSMLSSKTSGQP